MKTTYLLLLCLIALLNSGCKKCETTTHYDFPAATERYFGMYKMGNWWTYENQDGTKKDSIYFLNFSENEQSDVENNPCVTWQKRNATLKTLYLGSSSEIKFEYEGASNNSVFFRFYNANDVTIIAGGYSNKIINTDTLNAYLQDGKIYSNVIKTKSKSYFAPNIGLIRWETTIDTFTLKNHHIQ
jgi:hypothetical protein